MFQTSVNKFEIHLRTKPASFWNYTSQRVRVLSDLKETHDNETDIMRTSSNDRSSITFPPTPCAFSLVELGLPCKRCGSATLMLHTISLGDSLLHTRFSAGIHTSEKFTTKLSMSVADRTIYWFETLCQLSNIQELGADECQLLL